MERTNLKEFIPPQAVEIEMSVLGACLIDTEATDKAMELMQAEHFYKTAHKKIFDGISALYEKDQAIDIITLSDQLKKAGTLEEIGGSYYLTECVNHVTASANIEYHARIVVEKALLRGLISISNSISSEAYGENDDALNLLDKAEQQIFSLGQHKLKNDFEKLNPILHTAIAIMEKYQNQKGDIVGVPSGYKYLDDYLAGFQKSDLVIIAGRPSMGKTAFALNVARNAALQHKIPIGIFSLEMSKLQLAIRFISAEAKIDSNKFRRGTLSPADMQKVVAATGLLGEAPIFIDDTPGLSIFELRAKARRLKKDHDIQLLVVDYLQLMSGPPGESRQQQISDISRSLKAVAKELDVPVLALSQLSRAPEQRPGDKRPILSDLRESGAIEQDADVVMFVYRPEFYKIDKIQVGTNEYDSTNIAEIIIGKQRNGPIGTAFLTFLKDFGSFENPSFGEL